MLKSTGCQPRKAAQQDGAFGEENMLRRAQLSRTERGWIRSALFGRRSFTRTERFCAQEHKVPVHTDSRRLLWLNRGQFIDGRERKDVARIRDGQAREARRGRKLCPPHGPFVVDAVKDGSYVALCLACGLEGPEGEDVQHARLAFDQRWH